MKPKYLLITIKLSYETWAITMTANVPGLCVGRDTERDFYLFEILKLPINFYVTKCPPDAKDLLWVVNAHFARVSKVYKPKIL